MASYQDSSIPLQTEATMIEPYQLTGNFTSSAANDNSDLLRFGFTTQLSDGRLQEALSGNSVERLLDIMHAKYPFHGPITINDFTSEDLASLLGTTPPNQDSGQLNKENTAPQSCKSTNKKASSEHRAHPYKCPFKCDRVPVTTSAGILDHRNWNMPSLDPKSAALEVMGLTKVSNLGGPHKPNLMLCEQHSQHKKKYVLKCFPKKSERFLRELDAVGKIHHPYVLRPISFRMVKSISFTVSQYCSEGSLATHIGQMDIVTIVRHFIKIANALSYLHSRQVYHRDLRPENIMIDDRNNPMVSDFDMADTLHPGKTLVKNRRKTEADVQFARLYGAKVDAFSLGAILHCMLFEVQYHEYYDFFKQAQNAKLPDCEIFAILKQTIVNLVTPEWSARWNTEQVLGLFAKHRELLLEFCAVQKLEDIDPIFAKGVRRLESEKASQNNKKSTSDKNKQESSTSSDCK